jgi:hypothetical protein
MRKSDIMHEVEMFIVMVLNTPIHEQVDVTSCLMKIANKCQSLKPTRYPLRVGSLFGFVFNPED